MSARILDISQWDRTSRGVARRSQGAVPAAKVYPFPLRTRKTQWEEDKAGAGRRATHIILAIQIAMAVMGCGLFLLWRLAHLAGPLR